MAERSAPSRAALAAWLAYLIVPVPGWGILAGRPLESIGLVALLLVLWGWIFHRTVPLGRLVAVALALKLGLGLPLILDRGFLGFYYANTAWTPPHERSLDFLTLPATRIDERLQFHHRRHPWPVHFFNDLTRFNYFLPDQPNRQQLPFSVHWTGWIHSSDSERWRLYVTETATVRIDGALAIAPTRNARAETEMPMTAGWHRIDVLFTSPTGQRNFTAGLIDERSDRPLEAPRIYTTPAPAWRLAADHALRWTSWLLDLGLLVGLGGWLVYRVLEGGRAVLAGRRREALALAALLVAGSVLVRARPLVGVTLLFSGGDDWLSYETFARDIVLNGPLMTLGRPIGLAGAYFLQPFYAYFLAAVHLLLGEGLWGVYVIQQLLFAAMVWAIYRLTFALFGEGAAWPAAVGAAWLVWDMNLNRPAALPMESFLSESVFMPLLAFWLLAVARVDPTRRLRAIAGAGVLGGLAVVTRSTLLLALPGVVLAAAVSWWRTARRGTLLPLLVVMLGLAVPITAVFVRNVVAGGERVLITSSGPINLLLSNPPPAGIDLTRTTTRPIYRRLELDLRVRQVLEYAIQAPAHFVAGLARKARYALGLAEVSRETTLFVATWLTAVAGIVVAIRRAVLGCDLIVLAPAIVALSHFVAIVLLGVFTYGYRMVYPMYLMLLPYSGLAVTEVVARLPLARRSSSAVP